MFRHLDEGVLPRHRTLVLLTIAAVLATVLTGRAAADDRIVTLYAGVASAPGGNGTQWRSEVVLTNSAGASADVTLEVVPRGATGVVATQNLTLAGGETRRIPDLYTAMSIPSGAGTLRVTGDVLSWVRTFNQGATGTFGQDVPPVSDSPAFPGGTPVYFPINTPADAKTEFRSNLLLLNSGTTDLTFTISAGEASKTYDVPAGVFAQISGVGSWLGLPPGPAMLAVSASGSWSGMVSTIDPVLGDPTTVRGLVPTTRTVTQFSGVASAPGGNGTQWHSEAVLYNPQFAAQDVLLELIPRDGATPIASTTIHLGFFEQVKIPDVYQQFGVASGAGTLRVTGNVLTWVRTFNRGAGVTFGQDVPEVLPGVGNGPSARVSFPVATPADTKTDFRSNFLVYNHESRQITLTLTVGSATATLDVPAGTFTQKNNVGGWLGLPAGTSTMSVSGDGRWSGMVSTIDPYLGDPTTMIGIRTTGNPSPTAKGVPSGAAATATIGSAGGTLQSTDGLLSLTVPAGALAAPTTLSIQPITNLAWGGLGTAYRLGPDGTSFTKPVTLTFAAGPDEQNGISLEGLGIAVQDSEGYWNWLPGIIRDAASRTVSVDVSHFTDYSRVKGLNLVPAQATVSTNTPQGLLILDCYLVENLFGAGLRPSGERTSLWTLPGGRGYSCEDPTDGGRFSWLLKPQRWSVNGIVGGNTTLGRITQVNSHLGMFTAPGKAPTPATVAASVFVPDYLDLRNMTLISHITIGGELTGTLDLKYSDGAGVEVVAHARVDATPTVSNANGTAYDVTGTITVAESFPWYGMTCTCTEERTKPIPPDTSFAIRKKPTLAQGWVMGAVEWWFKCGGPSGVDLPFYFQFMTTKAGFCNTSDWWIPLDDETHPRGDFLYTCNSAFSVDGIWDLGPK